MMNSHITFVLGTRPELIKTAPVLMELVARGLPFSIVHTGQHYTASLDDVFFKELSLPRPAINLGVGSSSPHEQLASMVRGVGDWLVSHPTDVVLVQGDTNSVLAGALAAFKLNIPVAHLEAGLRSDDWTMPEEGNRVLTGRMASLHFCPTRIQVERLRQEGIVRGVHCVGNTVVDATLLYAKKADAGSRIIEEQGLEHERFGLLTLHRPSNVDDLPRLRQLMESLERVARELKLLLVFPVHPRTRERLARAGVGPRADSKIRMLEPVGYLSMLRLLSRSELVLTDSGGIQEEACVLHVPGITLRPNTERPETVAVGANRLVDSVDADVLLQAVREQLASPRDWHNPLGDGHAAAKVVDIMTNPTTRHLPSGSTVPPPL